MKAEELLRRYLEQRRELGESDLVLDRLSVDDVMRLVAGGASRTGTRTRETAPPPVAQRPESTPPVPTDPGPAHAADREGYTQLGDWRSHLMAMGAAPPGARSSYPARPSERQPEPLQPEPPTAAPRAPEPPAPRASEPDVAPAGIVAGGEGEELFGGPLAGVASLEQIAALVHECTRCPLYKTATLGVPGEGNPSADLMCVGEAPGANEDATGRPFVGEAGKLLTKILAAIKLSREEVFIANVLKHRPPGNRNPQPDEVTACRPYLVRQIELVRPKVIIAFGTFAAQTLLETKLAISKLRGSVHRYHGVPLVVTYHPAALLRNPAWKRPTWDDVQLARRILDRAT